jgi:hypothetical protein
MAIGVLKQIVGLKLLAEARVGSSYVNIADCGRHKGMNWTMSYQTFRFLVWLGYASVVFYLLD